MQFFVQPHAHFQIIMIVPFFLCKFVKCRPSLICHLSRLFKIRKTTVQQTTLQLVILNISIEIIKNRFPLNSNRSKFNFTSAPTARYHLTKYYLATILLFVLSQLLILHISRDGFQNRQHRQKIHP